MINKCKGCGITLNYSNPQKPGYTPKKDAKFCERCFKLKNYNKKEIINLEYDNNDIIENINKNADNVFFITDFLNISVNIIYYFNRITKPKILVINKVDYVPKSINKEKYITYIKETYKIRDEIILVSAIKEFGITSMISKCQNNKKNYICGFTNSGKSTIINKMLEFNNKTGEITTSLMPNTTLDIMKINLNENLNVYDTPGLINQLESFEENSHPKSYLRPITFQVKPNDIISINDTYYIKNIDNINSYTFYMSNVLKIKKVYKEEMLFNNDINIDNNSDIVIPGYGFINIKNKACIKLSNNIKNIEIRKSYFM